MPKIRAETMLSAHDAGVILGYDYQTMRNLIQYEQLPSFLNQFVKACKSSPDRECFSYMLPKYWTCMYAGVDPTLPTADIIEQIKAGKPPYIDQTTMMARLVMLNYKEKDATPAVQSK